MSEQEQTADASREAYYDWWVENSPTDHSHHVVHGTKGSIEALKAVEAERDALRAKCGELGQSDLWNKWIDAEEKRERAEAALRWYGEKAEAFARLKDKPSALVAVYVEMALDNGERASAALRDPAPAEEDPGLLKLAAQCAPAEEPKP